MMKRFKMDAARWVVPEQVADLSQVTFSKMLRLLWNHVSLQAMLVFRMGSWCRQKRIPLGWFFQRVLFFLYGLEMPVGADYGGGLYIAHPFGTVIAAQSMGENCTVIANVTVGMRKEWKFPIIGHRVFLGAGARVLGGLCIGDDVRVGANSVVLQDVPAGATVVGIPARVIRMKGENVVEPNLPIGQ